MKAALLLLMCRTRTQLAFLPGCYIQEFYIGESLAKSAAACLEDAVV